eukprot:2972446-Rhodomonas_salina.1
MRAAMAAQCPVLIYGRVLRVRYAVSSTELGSGYAESGTERGSGAYAHHAMPGTEAECIMPRDAVLRQNVYGAVRCLSGWCYVRRGTETERMILSDARYWSIWYYTARGTETEGGTGRRARSWGS